jgi:hypothetical protein
MPLESLENMAVPDGLDEPVTVAVQVVSRATRVCPHATVSAGVGVNCADSLLRYPGVPDGAKVIRSSPTLGSPRAPGLMAVIEPLGSARRHDGRRFVHVPRISLPDTGTSTGNASRPVPASVTMPVLPTTV